MRVIGYFLIIVGFFWLAIWCQMSVEPLVRSIAIENYTKYPPTKTYSDYDVRNAIHSVLNEYRQNAHEVILPGALMLLGGVLLDIASKRSKEIRK